MNKRSSALPPEKGPNPQGMKNGDVVNIGKGLQFRASGDVSYKTTVKPKTDVKCGDVIRTRIIYYHNK